MIESLIPSVNYANRFFAIPHLKYQEIYFLKISRIIFNRCFYSKLTYLNNILDGEKG